jgi:DNA-binding SARP family transcriptional activator
MLAQYRSGDVPGALTSFAQAQTMLRDQLGVDPGPDLIALHRAVLARDPDLDIHSLILSAQAVPDQRRVRPTLEPEAS